MISLNKILQALLSPLEEKEKEKLIKLVENYNLLEEKIIDCDLTKEKWSKSKNVSIKKLANFCGKKGIEKSKCPHPLWTKDGSFWICDVCEEKDMD